MISAILRNYRQSPRKVRVVANTIRGKKASDALTILTFLNKKAKTPLMGLLASAIANAKNNFNIDHDGLFVKEIRVDGGVTLKRRMPRARGMAYPINKRTSHVIITLAPVAEMKTKARRVKSVPAEVTAITK
jgi:large subunit ribosomal protein L22